MVCIELYFSPDSPLLILLIMWNLVSPSFRVRDYIAGHKSSLLSGAGILLTLSLFFSLSMHIGVVCFLGHASIFFVPLPLAVLAFAILISKSILDSDFKDQPMGPKITYSLLAGIFPVSSPRPRNQHAGKPDAVIADGEKNSYSELTCLHFVHFLAYLAGAATYFVLSKTSPAFNETMGKIETSSGVGSSWVILLSCPIACLFSVLTRLLFNRVEPWSIVQGPLDRSCCSCWPPKLKSTFKDQGVKIEEPHVAETPAAEVDEMIDYLADQRQQIV